MILKANTIINCDINEDFSLSFLTLHFLEFAFFLEYSLKKYSIHIKTQKSIHTITAKDILLEIEHLNLINK